MSADRFFADTSYLQALLNRRDHLHARATTLLPRVQAASEVWITEAVLIELGNALSSLDRGEAVRVIRESYRTKNTRVVAVDSALLQQGLDLYERRPDKAWGLTDCISFVVMGERGLTDALTADVHFRQSGFRALLLDAAGSDKL